MPEIIRPAEHVDLPQVAAVHIAASRVAYADVFPAEHFESMSLERRICALTEYVTDPEAELILLEMEDGQIAGFAIHSPTRDIDHDPQKVRELQSIYFHPDHWGKGLGQTLLGHIKTEVTEAGYPWLTVWSLNSNERALRFYRGQGFREDGHKKTTLAYDEVYWEIRLGLSLPG